MKAVLTLLAAALLTGCASVIVYAPRAQRVAMFSDERRATNMVINQDIPIEPKLADALLKATGAEVSGNSVLSPRNSMKGLR